MSDRGPSRFGMQRSTGSNARPGRSSASSKYDVAELTSDEIQDRIITVFEDCGHALTFQQLLNDARLTSIVEKAKQAMITLIKSKCLSAKTVKIKNEKGYLIKTQIFRITEVSEEPLQSTEEITDTKTQSEEIS